MYESLNIILTAIVIAGSIVIYVIPSHVCACAAHEKGLSYAKFLAFSLIFTPILGFLAVIAFNPPQIEDPNCRYCEYNRMAGNEGCAICGRIFNQSTQKEYNESLRKAISAKANQNQNQYPGYKERKK
jgi:hypothetical protein